MINWLKKNYFFLLFTTIIIFTIGNFFYQMNLSYFESKGTHVEIDFGGISIGFLISLASIFFLFNLPVYLYVQYRWWVYLNQSENLLGIPQQFFIQTTLDYKCNFLLLRLKTIVVRC